MISAEECISIFNTVIDEYHVASALEPGYSYIEDLNVPYSLLHKKCWTDVIQWHLEDEVRSPDITADKGWSLKKSIDKYNQQRTDIIEELDAWLYDHYIKTPHEPNAPANSETPGWIIDRLSILCIKIYHMNIESVRHDAGHRHMKNCGDKLSVLKEQLHDLSDAFDLLIGDLNNGRKKMKRYLQMKMYNDRELNPALYKAGKLNAGKTFGQ